MKEQTEAISTIFGVFRLNAECVCFVSKCHFYFNTTFISVMHAIVY